jgi:hypothetical protein
MIPAYHSIQEEALARCLEIGLKYGEAGARSQEPHIQQTNDYLDRRIPSDLKSLRLYRQQCLYMYADIDGFVLDIQSGELTPWQEWDAGEGFCKLRVMLDEKACYVSDLEAYDELVRAVQQNAGAEALEHLAAQYWRRVIPFTGVSPLGYKRIEIMVTQDIRPHHITVLQ